MAETAHTHSETPEEFKKHLGKYYVVFVALLCLTAITVGVSYLKLDRPVAITVALIIASVKAGLVASVFMHLLSEKKVIFAVLLLTALFFALVLLLPSLTVFEHHHGMPGT
ncbi:MAG TPA: cytochrome C oxidase subunit IV family protein [Myxococcales bacterium]|jgi:cytochrome c oxidase subunit 4|nr:cytochrome C oxidase subunit IV family protein [Myxococcales bacterium]